MVNAMMMKKSSGTEYQSKPVDKQGFVHFNAKEHAVWQQLMQRQMPLVDRLACQQFQAGVARLGLDQEQIPQLPDVDQALQQSTGWNIEPVPALIEFEHFFELLASKRFPVATFIRRPDEIDYIKEPDIFHEIFGHCPMLTDPSFAAFTEYYGQTALQADEEQRRYLARLYWFTVEFGLVRENDLIKIFGGGILSSHQETQYCLDNESVYYQDFSVLDALRTPYRIDILQPTYFILDSIEQLFDLTKMDLLAAVEEAKRYGMYPPLFST